MFAEINKEALRNLPIALNTTGHSKPQQPINHPNGISYHEFIWVIEGSGDFCVDGKAFTLDSGMGAFIPAGTQHSYQATAESSFSTSWFTFSMAIEPMAYLGLDKYKIFRIPSFMESENIALMNFACGDSTPLSRSVNTYSFINEIVTAISSQPESISDKTRKYLESHYSEPLTLDLIAEAVGSTRFSLCHIYKKSRGVGVVEDLNAIRIAKAKRFLKYTTYSVSEISKMCGFENAGYFTKCFKDRCKVTPAEYRKKV